MPEVWCAVSADIPPQHGEVVIWDNGAGPGFRVMDLDAAVARFEAKAAEGYYPPVVLDPSRPVFVNGGFTGSGDPRVNIGRIKALRRCGTKLLATLDVEHSACVSPPDQLHEVAIVRAGTVPRSQS